MEPNSPWIVTVLSRVTRAARLTFFAALVVEIVVFSIAGGWSWMAAQHMSRYDPRLGLLSTAIIGIPVVLAAVVNSISGDSNSRGASTPTGNGG